MTIEEKYKKAVEALMSIRQRVAFPSWDLATKTLRELGEIEEQWEPRVKPNKNA